MPDTTGGFMTRVITAAALVLALAAPRAVAGPEAAAAGAERALQVAFAQPLPQPAGKNWRTYLPVAQAGAQMSWFSLSVLAQLGAEAPGASAQVGDLDLATLLNKQLKSPLKYSLGGKDVWVSGAFDRSENAYVSILVDGSEPVFFNVKGLLDKEESVRAGANTYKLYLAPNVINQMKSEIILENAADEDDKTRITLKKMLDAVSASGAAVTIGGLPYKVFYTDDVKNGRVDKTKKTFTFILTENGQFHVFMIPADLVPGDRIAVFKMFRDARVGLMQKDGKLKIHENP
ncbi:MAG: hypothetical protein M0D55_16385 [Elusimicrobiota bacterium]|nr:MAG: hypothetical protein M0D55_16385 [Elusimicrobiota bacterium]